MSNNFIPDDVAQFIVERIDSVAQMEALLLFRSHPTQEWSVEELAKRLYITQKQTADLLSSLCAHEILVAISGESPKYRYQPGSKKLQLMVDRVTEIYSKHLVPVTNLIHSKPTTRVQEFADAFKFRKDE